jgi:hypothetical protein
VTVRAAFRPESGALRLSLAFWDLMTQRRRFQWQRRQRIQDQSCSPGPRSSAELLHCSYHFPTSARGSRALLVPALAAPEGPILCWICRISPSPSEPAESYRPILTCPKPNRPADLTIPTDSPQPHYLPIPILQTCPPVHTENLLRPAQVYRPCQDLPRSIDLLNQ